MANSPLGLYLDVDLRVERAQVDLDPVWLTRLQQREVTEQQVLEAARQFNNLIKQTRIWVRVVK